jgi:glycosyltransferase involved in cell wall biosynthesis
LKIAFINQPQDPIEAGEEQRGSVAIVNWELARRLSERHEVVIYAPRAPGQPRKERWERIEIRRVRFVAKRFHKTIQLLKGRFSSNPYFTSPGYFREYFWQIARDLRSSAADVVHLPQQLQFAPLIRAAAPGMKVVVHMHQDELAQLEKVRLSRRLAQLDAVVTVSDYVTERARARFPQFSSRIHTIGNGVDVQRFHPDPARSASDLRPQRILFVGRISPDKGVHLLMEAFDRLARERSDLDLTLVG